MGEPPTVLDVDALAQERHEAVEVDLAALGDDVLDQPVQQLARTLDARVRIRRKLINKNKCDAVGIRG